MKIVITGYNTCCLNPTGGVQVRVKKIYELLTQRKDIEVEYFRPMEINFDDIDILHLFKLDYEYYSLVHKAKNKGIKVVLSSIVPIRDGFKIDIYRRIINKLPILSSYKMLFRILNSVDAIISETKEESSFISKHYGVDAKKNFVIPNGIEEPKEKDDSIFDLIGEKVDYVLSVGRFDSNKNQLNLIKAMKGTGIDCVFVGGEDCGNASYYEECRRKVEGDSHFHFLGWVDSESDLLKSAYANAKVFAFPSYQETFGIALVEAAIHGCNLAVSKTLPIHDFHAYDDAFLFNPANIDDIRSKVISAFKAPLSDVWKNRTIKKFSWNSVINSHIQIYEDVLKK